MNVLVEWRNRLAAFLAWRREEAEMDDELRFHLEMETEKNLRSGMSPAEARRRAAIEFGGLERAREDIRANRGLAAIEILLGDIRYAARGVRRNFTFSLTLVLTLALGIGAATMMFSIIDALLLRPLPFRSAEQLVDVRALNREGQTQAFVSWEDGRVWRERTDVFESLMATSRASVLYTGGPEPLTLPALAVESNFNEVLGVAPALGRGFTVEDGHPGAPPTVLLDHAFWTRAFGRDPNVLGREIDLEGAPYRVIGVMPAGFRYPLYATTDVWLTVREDGTFRGTAVANFNYVGRIATDRVEGAQGRARVVALTLEEELPRESGWGIQLDPIDEMRSNGFATSAVALLGGSVLLLLLAAAANAAGMLLVRAWSRTREFAVRVALGASRRRLVRQVLLESLLIGGAAALFAALIGTAGLRLIREIIPPEVVFFAPFEIVMESRAIAMTFLVALAVGLLIGIPPALRASHLGQVGANGGLASHALQTPTRSRARRTLLFVQVTLSAVLLAGTGLLANSYARLMSIDPGFRTENVAVLTLTLPPSSYPQSADRAAFLDRLRERLVTLPAVETALINPGIPAGYAFMIQPALETEAGVLDSDHRPTYLPYNVVDPEFFDALGVRVIAGRPFNADDAGTSNRIVDRRLANLLWGDANPIGQTYRTAAGADWSTVVGVVDDLRLMGPDDRLAPVSSLVPRRLDQAPSLVTMAVLTTDDPRPLFPAIRAAVHELDPRQPIQSLRLASDQYVESVALPRFLLVIISLLAAIALALVLIGIHGLISYQIMQRRREIGVRIALGATLRRLSLDVAGEGMLIVALACAAGIGAALAGGEVIRGLLYGVEPTDPLTLAGALAVVFLTATLACLRPVYRASRTDVVEALRVD